MSVYDADQSYNPIQSVNGSEVPCPSSYKWQKEMISSADAGRTEDTVMDVKKIGELVRLDMEWQNVDTATVSQILKAFTTSDGYMTIEYLDAEEGDYVTSEFYIGNRSAPAYNTKLGLWQNVSFGVIQKSGI